MRERAAVLATEIARDLPDFTAHDVEHLDALWELASQIAGDGFSLTPAEAYILGGAILLHDLGMAVAAYPEGVETLRQGTDWADAVAMEARLRFDRGSTTDDLENPPPELAQAATRRVLRLRHAREAQRLATYEWTHRGERTHLIDDSDLRSKCGPLMGLVAHSHWWSVNELLDHLRPISGAPAPLPPEWTTRPVLLACLLRTADAAHLDASRTPRLLRALHAPRGISAVHWDFHELLNRATVVGHRLQYTAVQPFERARADAWWLCFDALQMVDRELQEVDALLADLAQPRLRARGVSGADSPVRLAECVPTASWLPIDARVHVSDVFSLTQRIGGKQLYGDREWVPLRELLQNGIDAVRARRLLDVEAGDWGEVVVRSGPSSHGQFLEITDNGVGMPAQVLTNHLLDFGGSLWRSEEIASHLPGLAARGFDAYGRFGIGFFSVFMWKGRLSVRSRPYVEARSQTHVLELDSDVRARPLLRRAEETERLGKGGTTVRMEYVELPTFLREKEIADDAVEPDATATEEQEDDISDYEFTLLSEVRDEVLVRTKGTASLQSRYHFAPDDLAALCAWLAPASPVDIVVDQGQRHRVVEAHDWISLDGVSLLRRSEPVVWQYRLDEAEERRLNEVETLNLDEIEQHTLDPIGWVANHLRLITSEAGEPVARAALLPGTFERVGGVLTLGGLRATMVYCLPGIWIGDEPNAARDHARPRATRAQLSKWATEQATLLNASLRDEETRLVATAMVSSLGGNPGPLPICRTSAGALSYSELTAWASQRTNVVLIDLDATLVDYRDIRFHDVQLADGIIDVNEFGFEDRVVALRFFGADAEADPDAEPVRDAALAAVAAAWPAMHALRQREYEDPAVRVGTGPHGSVAASLLTRLIRRDRWGSTACASDGHGIPRAR
jgi:hypothetical protein